MPRVGVYQPVTNDLVYVNDVDLDHFKSQGYVEATPEDIALEQVKAEYGSIPHQVGAAVTGALSGATLGLTDIALAKLGADEALKAYEQISPGVRGVSKVVGATIPILLSAGTLAPEYALTEAGALGVAELGAAGIEAAEAATSVAGAAEAAAAARAAAAATKAPGIVSQIASYTPAAMAQQAGQAAVARLGLEAAAGAAQGIGGTAARWATQAGVESALQGVGQQAARLAIDNQLNGEHIGELASAGLESGLTGMLIGGGLGTLGGTVKKLSSTIPEALKKTSLGRQIESAVYRNSARIAGLSEADAEAASMLALPEYRAMGLRGKEMLADIVTGKQAGPLERRVAQAGSLQKNLDEKFIGQQITSEAIRDGSLKVELVRGNVADDADRLIAQQAFARNELGQALEEVQTARAASGLEYAQAGLKQLEHDLTKAAKSAEEAIAEGGTTGAENLYGVLDVNVKRAIGRAVSSYKRIKNPTSADFQTIDMLESMYERFRTGLENTEIFGNVGTLQSEMNAPMTRAIRANPAVMRKWYESIEFGKDPTDPWRGGRVANSDAIMANLEAAANPTENFADRAIREQIAAETEWQDAALRLGNFKNMEGLRGAFQRQAQLNAEIVKQLDEAQKVVRVNDLINRFGGSNDTLGGLVAGAALATHNPLAVLIAPMMKPRLAMRAFDMLDSMATGQSGRLGAAVNRSAKAIRDSSVAATKALPVTGALAMRFDDRRKKLEKLAVQAPAVRAKLERETAWMEYDAPRARAVAINTAMQKLDYLRAHMPKGMPSSTPFAPDLPPPKSEMQTWLNRLRAVDNPTSILDDLAKGTLKPESVDAVKTVYPETFRDIQRRVTSQITGLEANGKRPTYAQRVQLGMLLEIPTDPTMTPEVMGAVQGSYAAQPDAVRQGGTAPGPGPARGRRAPNLAKGYRSGSEKTELTSERPT